MNAKFATSSVVFDCAYGKIDEFLGGITEHVGLPATNLMKGMENNFCHGDAAHTKFTTSNYEGTTTTAAQEFEYVVKPDLTAEYPGVRSATNVNVYLLAAGATRRNHGEHLNTTASVSTCRSLRLQANSARICSTRCRLCYCARPRRPS